MASKKIIRSDLSHTHTNSASGLTVEVFIYSVSGINGWVLEVLSLDGRATVWTQVFGSEEDAFDQFASTVADIGVPAILEQQVMPPPTRH